MYKTLLLTSMAYLLILFNFNELEYNWKSNLYFHTNLEIISTLIALIVGSLALVRFYTKKSALFLMVGIGFIGTGVLDGYHTLVTSISFKEQMPLDIQHLIPWSWLASRTFTALFFMGTAMYITEKHQPELNERYPYYFSILFLFIVVYLISTVALPDPSSLSDFYPRIAEIIPAFIYMLALIIYIIRKNNKENTFATYLAFSIILNVLAEYPLMINSETVFDARFNIAHILKILSYLSVLVGLFDSMYKTFIYEQLSAEMIAFAETRTKEKERKLILDSVNHGLTFYDANLKLTYANKKFIDMFHVPQYLSISGISMIQIFEFIKKNYKSTPDDRRISCPENAYELALNGKDISSQCVFADEKVIAMKGCAVSNEYIITFNDVTDFVNAKVDSQKNSEKLSEIINTSPIGIIISCPINDSIQWINTKAVCLLGYSSAEDIIRNSLSEHWAINEPFSVIKNTQKNNKLSEILLTNKDNDKFWCYLSRDTITLDNGTFDIFWIYDITDEKKFKEQSFRNEKLASLGGLVSGVADEINTPLGICITASSLICEELDICSNKLKQQVLKKKDFEHFTEVSQDALRLLRNNLNSTAQLIEKFKDISSIEFVEQKKSIQIDLFFQETLSSLKPYIKKSKVRLSLAQLVTNDIFTYPGALSKVILNLVLNSIQHGFKSNKPGIITISTRINDLNELVICYTDNGIGISPSLISKVMDPFFTTANPITSNGLGLSITHNIVTSQLMGSIVLESELSKGVKVTILIPNLEKEDIFLEH